MIYPRSDLSKPQTTPQILRCIVLRGYTARVEGGGLRIRGPQRLAGPLPASIETRRDELIGFLEGRADGAWPPTRASARDSLPGRHPYLPGSSRSAVGRVNLSPIEEIMGGCKQMFVMRRREYGLWA